MVPLVEAGLLSAVAAAAPTPLWVIARDGSVAFANKAAVSVLGYRSIDDVLGAPSHDTLHRWRPDGSRYAVHACPIMDRRGTHPACDVEWFLTRAGQPLPVRWSVRPVGERGARLLAFTDASDRLDARRRAGSADLDAAADSVGAPSRALLRERLLAHVQRRFRDPDFAPARLAAESHVSLRLVQQLLAEDGRSPATEIRRARLEFATAQLRSGSTVQHACAAAGFSDVGTFTRAFRRRYGQTPSELRHARLNGGPTKPRS